MIKGRSGPARMKRATYMIAGGIILLSLTSFTLLKIRVGQDVKDEHNTPGDRSRVAIWTLGRIKSEKAASPVTQFSNPGASRLRLPHRAATK